MLAMFTKAYQAQLESVQRVSPYVAQASCLYLKLTNSGKYSQHARPPEQI
jgi:hypothetical protein